MKRTEIVLFYTLCYKMLRIMFEYKTKEFKGTLNELENLMNEYGKHHWEFFSTEKVDKTMEIVANGGIVYIWELKMKRKSQI